MIDQNEIDDKFDSEGWQNISQLTGSETNEELVAFILTYS